ncbi:DUF6233 domain-containing protein [Streptomyces sp. IB2014 016-6]|uniref:DUF6233 domain-containing protein n=1 Tax=Streptomyces sp. IB2014 016-6 TaxID=2517818 RepID=UPI0011CA7A3E|nr:DUF6233 domain-containing protein [Streptomyces sp. IB2014 016-6]TXL91611.1 hypothetical protein EW053_04600 [Streptomyces sp. IB2014 016-6]
MSESTPEERLAALHFLRRVQQRDLARTDQWIATEEQRAAEHARRRPPPPPPDWALERGKRAKPKAIHTSQCWNPFFMQAITRDQAIEALTRGAVPPCARCEPDKELGVLE